MTICLNYVGLGGQRLRKQSFRVGRALPEIGVKVFSKKLLSKRGRDVDGHV